MAITVKRKQDENIDSLLRRLKKKCKEDKLFFHVMERTYFKKPSEKKRLKFKNRKQEGDT